MSPRVTCCVALNIAVCCVAFAFLFAAMRSIYMALSMASVFLSPLTKGLIRLSYSKASPILFEVLYSCPINVQVISRIILRDGDLQDGFFCRLHHAVKRQYTRFC